MAKGGNIEDWRSFFTDEDVHVAIASITSLHIADDRSYLKVRANIFPENREVIARMTWDAVGPESGTFTFPNPNDMVLIAFAEGDADQAYVIRRLTSKEDKIPLTAVDGSTVIKALTGKKVWVTSDTIINLSKGDSAPTENLVLGQVWKEFSINLLSYLIDLCTSLSTETHTGNLGYPTAVPDNASDYLMIKSMLESIKSSPVEDEAILSDLSFTEK